MQNGEDEKQPAPKDSVRPIKNLQGFIRDIKWKQEIIRNIYKAKKSENRNDIENIKVKKDKVCHYVFGKINKNNNKIVERAMVIAGKEKRSCTNKNKQIYLSSTSDDYAYFCRPFVQMAMKEFYLNKRILPCFEKFKEFSSKPERFPAYFINVLNKSSTFSTFLDQLGYKWQTIPGTDKSFLVEKSEYIRERFIYLDRVMKYREEGREFVYITERDFKKKNSTQFYGYIFLAVYSKRGFMPDTCWTYFGKTKQHLYYDNWILKTVVPTLAENTVVVLETNENSHLNETTNDVPTMMCSKAKMMKWLSHKEIPYKQSMHKGDLYQLVEKTLPLITETRDEIDIIIENKGTYVVRRPKWLPGFDYFDKLWHTISEEKWPQEKLRDIKSYLDQLPREFWKNLECSIAERERICMKEDGQIEEIIDSVLAMIKNEGLEVLESTWDDELNTKFQP